MTNPFEKAAEVIHEKGWTTGNLVDEDDSGVCLLGALYLANGLTEHEYEHYPLTPEVEFMARLLRPRVISHMGFVPKSMTPQETVYRLNDNYLKDADEAVHLLKEAAEAWEESHG